MHWGLPVLESSITLIANGVHATMFDPDDFLDRATYGDPHQYPTGARTTVMVNGTLVVENAQHSGATPGRVLRRVPDGGVA